MTFSFENARKTPKVPPPPPRVLPVLPLLLNAAEQELKLLAQLSKEKEAALLANEKEGMLLTRIAKDFGAKIKNGLLDFAGLTSVSIVAVKPSKTEWNGFYMVLYGFMRVFIPTGGIRE